MKDPMVSVVVPAYNAEKYVVKTLESVQNQTYSNWELILVDDGSNDRTRKVVEKHQEANPGVLRLVSHPHNANRGTSASRNLGLRQARGELVCFLDADDAWMPEFLEFYVGKFRRFPDLAMAYGPCIYWYPEREPAEEGNSELIQTTGFPGGLVDSGVLFKQFLEHENIVPSPSGVMLRRSRVLEVGGWEEAFRGMFDDQALYSMLFLRGSTVFVADRPHYYYRQHAESLCRTAVKDNKLYESRKHYLAWLKDYLQRMELKDASFRKKVDEQATLLEIRNYVDQEFQGTASKCRAVKRVVKQVATLKRGKASHFNIKVIRYSLSYLVVRILSPRLKV